MYPFLILLLWGETDKLVNIYIPSSSYKRIVLGCTKITLVVT